MDEYEGLVFFADATPEANKPTCHLSMVEVACNEMLEFMIGDAQEGDDHFITEYMMAEEHAAQQRALNAKHAEQQRALNAEHAAQAAEHMIQLDAINAEIAKTQEREAAKEKAAKKKAAKEKAAKKKAAKKKALEEKNAAELQMQMQIAKAKEKDEAEKEAEKAEKEAEMALALEEAETALEEAEMALEKEEEKKAAKAAKAAKRAKAKAAKAAKAAREEQAAKEEDDCDVSDSDSPKRRRTATMTSPTKPSPKKEIAKRINPPKEVHIPTLSLLRIGPDIANWELDAFVAVWFRGKGWHIARIDRMIEIGEDDALHWRVVFTDNTQLDIDARLTDDQSIHLLGVL
jgi:hypothetical protein